MRLVRQLSEDKALRDAALALFKADLRFIRNDLDRRGIRERVTDRLGDGARDLADDALDYATAHKGVVATAVAAVALWFVRTPLLRALGEMFDGEDEEPEQAPPPHRSSGRSQQSPGDPA
jgi:hypothetical protein